MIENDAQLAQARDVIVGLETALAALRDRVAPTNAALFNVMAESYAEEILRIRAEMDEYLGTASALATRAPLWMVLEGRQLPQKDVSSRILSTWLSKVRTSVLTVTEFFETGQVRTAGRPTEALLDATDPRIVALAPGSIRVGLRLPSQYVQHDAFEEGGGHEQEVPAARALARLLEMAMWAGSDAVELPTDRFPDRDESIVLASEAADLVPSGRGNVESVRFEGALIPTDEPIHFRPGMRPRLRGLIQLLTEVVEETIVGTIREIDLDAQRIILRERGPDLSDVKCHLPEELMDEAEGLLDLRVQVSGLVSSATPDAIDVQTLERFDGT